MAFANVGPRVFLAISTLALSASALGCGSGGTSSTGGAGGATTTSSSSTTTGSGGDTTTSSSAGGTGGTGTTTSTSSSTTSTSSSTTSSSSTIVDWAACHTCLQTACAPELAACDAGCMGIQTCLDAVCGHLSEIGAPDEGTCQVYCQAQHFSSKDEHLDLVNCAQQASECIPPCSYGIGDWEECVDAATDGACGPKLDACSADVDCVDYITCALTCTTAADCKACGASPEGMAGRALFEDYWLCVETDCILELWLPG
jgi:hypothetical protein